MSPIPSLPRKTMSSALFTILLMIGLFLVVWAVVLLVVYVVGQI
jgi:hypothetical protein